VSTGRNRAFRARVCRVWYEVKALNDLAKNVVLWIVIAVVLATVVSNFSTRTSAVQEVPYSAFLAQVKDGSVRR